MMIKKLDFSHISKFAVVGILSTFIHSSVYWLFITLSVVPQLSNAYAFFVALTFSFIGHKHWTFNTSSSENRSIHTFTKFLTSSLFGFALNASWVEICNILSINPAYAVIGITFITPVLTFFILKQWVFRP